MRMVERTQASDGSVELRYTWLYYIAQYTLVGSLILYALFRDGSGEVPVWLGVPFVAAFLARILGPRAAKREIKRAMKQGSVEASGSGWNPSNPLRFKIPPSQS